MAALAVVAYHFTAMDHVWHRRADSIFPGQPAAYGWLGVYLFFLISGFVICMSSWGRGVGAFLLSRAVRLYPAYWLSVLAVTVVLTIWPYVQKPVSWRSTLINLTMFHEPLGVPAAAEVYWTLWAELRFYLLFSLIVWWGLTYRRVVTFCLVWLGAVAAARVLPDGGGALVRTVLMTDYAPLFTAGVGLYLMHRFPPTPLSRGIVAASYLLALPTVLDRARQEVDPGAITPSWPPILLLAVCFLLITAVALGWLNWLRGRWLVVLGAMTYPLYLLHLDLGGTILYLWQHDLPAPLLVATVTAAMILLAWLVHRYVERPVAPLMKRALLRIPALRSAGRVRHDPHTQERPDHQPGRGLGRGGTGAGSEPVHHVAASPQRHGTVSCGP